MTEGKPFRFKFFLPDARILEKDEIANLPREKLTSVKAGGREGLWLEIAWPDASCMDDAGNITIPAKRGDLSGKKGFFLSLFCPGDSCEIVQSSDFS